MCIVKKNLAEVRWILDFYRDRSDAIPSSNLAYFPRKSGLQMLLEARVTGTFFQEDKHYFGGRHTSCFIL